LRILADDAEQFALAVGDGPAGSGGVVRDRVEMSDLIAKRRVECRACRAAA
jgi:hypothetical protein